MSARSIRRAAERTAAKLAAKASIHVTANEESTDQPLAATAAAGATFNSSTELPSDARLAANRANAKLSTGPTTAAGRAKSSMNAVKTGLTSRSILLPTEDAVPYQQHLDRHFKQFAPTTDEEKSLVQSIADTEWRLLRIFPLEASVWAVARIKMADLYPDISDPINRQSLIDGEIQLAYRKDLSNLALQERRLRNQSAADTAKLEKLRSEHREKHAKDFDQGVHMYKMAQRRNLPFDPAFFGFVFSIEDLEQHVTREQASCFVKGLHSDLTQEQFEALMTQRKMSQAA
jgi:hypothetical protein